MHRKYPAIALAVVSAAVVFVFAWTRLPGLIKGKPEQLKASTAAVNFHARDTGGLELPLSEKPVTLSFLVNSEFANRSSTWVVQEIENRTGIKMDIRAIPPSSYHDNLKIILASGNLPDVLYGVKRRDLNTLGLQGIITAINKHASELPNFRKIFMENSENNVYPLTADDGNLYLWPYYEAQRSVNHGFLYRKDIFDKHGIKMWNTTDEFHTALLKLKELYPASLPYASKTKEGIFKDWAPGWGLRLPVTYDPEQNVWSYAYIQPEFKEMLDFIKKLYSEGLIDPDFLTDTQADWTAKMTMESKSFVTYDWIGRLDMFYEQVKSNMPDYNLRYANPVGPAGKVKSVSKVADFGLAVTESPRKIYALKFLDYTASSGGAELLTLGAEGVTYAVDNSGHIYYPDFPNRTISIKDLEEKFGLFMIGVYTRIDSRSVFFNFTEKEQEAQDMIIKKDRLKKADPILKFSQGEQAVLDELEDSLENLGNKFASKYIINKSSGTPEWNEWINTARAAEAARLESAYNSAQKRLGAGK